MKIARPYARLGVFFLCTWVTPATAQIRTPTWIGLYDSELISWLENENQLESLCGSNLPSPPLEECIRAQLSPLVHTLPVFTAPEPGSPRLGQILLIAMPGKGLFAYWDSAADTANAPLPFTPDVYDSDWGYGPYFHQSVIGRRAEWFELPEVPLEQTGWIWIDGDLESRLLSLEEGEIVTMRDEGWVITGVGPDGAQMRREQPADMWCEVGQPPAVTATTARLFSLKELSDGQGHYLITPKYMRGC
jgi:hypothetical protein